MTEMHPLVLAAPVAPLPAQEVLYLLTAIGTLLGAAVLLGRLAVAFRLPAVLGELATGVLLGPSVLGHLAPGLSGRLLPADGGSLQLVDAVGQIGVLLLVGLTGMHLDTSALRQRRAVAAAVSAGGLVVPLGLGIGVGLLAPQALMGPGTDRTVFALFLGVALCVSAIPVIAKTLFDMDLMHGRVGQLIICAAAVDDIAGWLLLSVASALVTAGDGLGSAVGPVCSLAAILALWRIGGRRLLRSAVRSRRMPQEPRTLAAVVVVLFLLSSAATQALGLEALLGAFLCGTALGSTGRLPAERLAPLRSVVLGVLAPIFFATAGLRMDLTALADPTVLGWGLGILVIAVAGKFGGVFAGARAVRLSSWEAFAVGAGLNARGVIEVVVATVALRAGVFGTDIYTIVVLIALATSALAPPLLRYSSGHLDRSATTGGREPAPTPERVTLAPLPLPEDR